MDLLAGGDIHMCSSRVDGCPSEGAPPNQRVAGVQLGQWTGESEEGRSQANGKILCIHLYQSKHIEINFQNTPFIDNWISNLTYCHYSTTNQLFFESHCYATVTVKG